MAFNFSTWLMRKRIDAHVRLSGKPMEHRRVVNPYHGVGIAPGIICCQAAAGLKGRRYLSAEAPTLPLAACDAKSCQCRYVHFEDRRQGEDRRQPKPHALGHSVQERRQGRGNRAND